MSRRSHWDDIYETRAADEVSWFEQDPRTSYMLVSRAVQAGARSVIEIGGGASNLVDRLLEFHLDRVAVLDVSEAGLSVAKRRLGAAASKVEWIADDVTTIEDVGRFDVWHDRAVFHFLTSDSDRRSYVRLAERSVPTGGIAIIATFAPDGPDRCSGLPVRRYDEVALADEFGDGFLLIDSQAKAHVTPRGITQNFLYASLRRSGE